eukprot:UN24371
MNWTNALFDKALTQLPLGPVKNNTKHADYNTTVESWLEQRTYVNHAPEIVKEKYPNFYSELQQVIDDVSNIDIPDENNYEQINDFDAMLTCNNIDFQFNKDDGSLRYMSVDQSKNIINNTFGRFTYQTLDGDDYIEFMKNMYADHHVCTADDKSHHACDNFNKSNLTEEAKHRELNSQLVFLGRKKGDNTCEFISETQLPDEVQVLAGAPKKIITVYTFSKNQLIIDVRWYENDQHDYQKHYTLV